MQVLTKTAEAVVGHGGPRALRRFGPRLNWPLSSAILTHLKYLKFGNIFLLRQIVVSNVTETIICNELVSLQLIDLVVKMEYFLFGFIGL